MLKEFFSPVISFSQQLYYYIALYSPLHGPVPPRFLDPSKKDFKEYSRVFFTSLLETTPIRTNYNVLDMGCGAGHTPYGFYSQLRASRCYYDGFDMSRKPVKWCKQKYESFPRFDFKHADVYHPVFNPKGKIKGRNFEFPYYSGQYNLVISADLFCNLLPEDVRQFISEMSRVMKKGAACYIRAFVINKSIRDYWEIASSPFREEKPDMNGMYTILHRHGSPELIALEQSFVEECFERSDLQIRRPIRMGNWSGYPGTAGSFYDILFARKI